MVGNEEFYLLRRCMREPIDEIFRAAHLLDRATGAHLAGDHSSAQNLIRAANIPAIAAWTESLWGSRAENPDQGAYLRIRGVARPAPYLNGAQRAAQRMPSSVERRSIIERYGRNCVFCGIPLITKDVRSAFRRAYPEALPWGVPNKSQHAAFQCMWLQFDHVIPHSRGGDSAPENVVVTCAPCNYGRVGRTLDEVGLIDPRSLPVHKTSWDGLERILTAS